MSVNHPKIIISDVDGTLLDWDERITDDFKELAALVAEKNLAFTLASGRSYEQLMPIIKVLKVSLPVVANNGAGCYMGDEDIFTIMLDPLSVKEAVMLANEMDMVIVMSDGRTETAYRHNAYIQNQIEKFGRYNRFYIPLENEWPNIKMQKILFTDPEKPGRIEQVEKALKKHGDKLHIVKYNDRSLDVMPKNCSKGRGVQQLAAHLGIPMEAVMAIGDAQNDHEMLQYAGIGVAVANADLSLKQGADYVCKNNNIQGVIEAIRKFC